MENVELKQVLELILTHTEEEDRDYCDADGLYCRSECARMAAKRVNEFFKDKNTNH